MAIPASTPEKTRPARSSIVSSAAASASWVALLAVTSLGGVPVARTRAQVSGSDLATVPNTGAGYRLIVQSYAPRSMQVDRLPGVSQRPLGSAQRAVTAEELATGVAVGVFQLEQMSAGEAPVIVAWVEQGAPDLEFDAARARPALGAAYGIAQSADGSAQIVLRRQAA